MEVLKTENDKCMINGVLMKRVSLFLLTIQSAVNVLVSHHVRSRPGDLFISSTAIVMSELVKFLICVMAVFVAEGMHFRSAIANFRSNLLVDCRDNLLIGVPGIIYAVQNNLFFLAVTQLSASVFQITYQLKILTTAIFFRLILHRIVTWRHYMTLILLFLGIAVTQFDTSVKGGKGSNTQNSLLGFLYVFIACNLSGFASVYFEKLLKSTSKTIVMRNIQLSIYGFMASLISVFIQDWALVSTKGFFHGYDGYVWLIIFIQSVGGLICAAVVRYADNILKSFSTSLAIILTVLISSMFLGIFPSYQIIIGTTLVILSTFLYVILPQPAVMNDQLPTAVTSCDRKETIAIL